MSDNMNIWDAVSKTDPAHTKHVNQRGGFTAIDASYQIMNATSQFGPVGIGWGYIAHDPIFQGGVVIVPVTLWHGDRSNTFGPEYGCEKMGGDRVDTDAPKKATTDALTKLLARLGFNADVFLGQFDDSKYVEQRKREVQQEKAPKPSAHEVEAAIASINNCDDMKALGDNWTALNKNAKHVASEARVIKAKDDKKAQLHGGQ